MTAPVQLRFSQLPTSHHPSVFYPLPTSITHCVHCTQVHYEQAIRSTPSSMADVAVTPRRAAHMLCLLLAIQVPPLPSLPDRQPTAAH